MYTDQTQQPPLRPGDRVRFIHDRDHVETVNSIRHIIAESARAHWQVVTSWDGHRRVADAAEFIIEDMVP